jgi:ferredoxin/flavodoxin---NADP+ reductase
MNRILDAWGIAPAIKRFRIEAPRIAQKHRAGQFVIVRATGDAERIPLTIASSDPASGSIDLVVQGVGKTTRTLNLLEAGDTISDLVGPLGRPSEVALFGTAVLVGGGVGTAIVYPNAVALAAAGNDVIAIVGGRCRDYVLLEEELRDVCVEVHPTTDDGSYGYHGLVTERLADLIATGRRVDRVMAAGPVPMMRAVADVTRLGGIATVVSLNPIMVDGTGMCGGCRVSVGGVTRFACVDGPEFDAHQVDFDLLERRNRSYAAFEYYRNEEFTAEHGVGIDLPRAG